MLSEDTIEKMKDMHLSVMAEMFRNISESESYASLTFEEKVGLMIDSEWNNRQNNRLKRLKHIAKFSIPDARIENIRYDAGRHLDKGFIVKLSSCTYIQKARNVIILGATGTGKSYLSCALGNSAINNFYTVKYIRLPDLFTELEEARAERKYKQVLESYKKVPLLIIDEWLTLPTKVDDARDLLQIIDGRFDHCSTIFCTQFEVEGWYEKIGDPICADAICDRIVNNAYTIRLDGDSMRKVIWSEKEDSPQNTQ